MDFYFSNNKFYKNHKPKVKPNDLFVTYKYMGQGEWSLDSESSSPDFSVSNLDFKQWVVLKKTDKSWVHLGPYSSKEIFNKIESSEMNQNSVIWKKGYQNWVYLKEAPEFKYLYTVPTETPDFFLLESVDSYVRSNVVSDIGFKDEDFIIIESERKELPAPEYKKALFREKEKVVLPSFVGQGFFWVHKKSWIKSSHFFLILISILSLLVVIFLVLK